MAMDQVTNCLEDGVDNFRVDSIGMLNDELDGFADLQFSVLLLNVRSVRELGRFDDFLMQLDLMRRRPSVIVLTETWIEHGSVGLYGMWQ